MGTEALNLHAEREETIRRGELEMQGLPRYIRCKGCDCIIDGDRASCDDCFFGAVHLTYMIPFDLDDIIDACGSPKGRAFTDVEIVYWVVTTLGRPYGGCFPHEQTALLLRRLERALQKHRKSGLLKYNRATGRWDVTPTGVARLKQAEEPW